MEKAWVSRARAGDATAFEAIFRTYYERLCGFAERLVHSPDAARDVVQDVFVRVWEQRENCQGCDNLKGYLFTAVKNKAFKFLRHRNVVHRSAEDLAKEQRVPGSASPPMTPEEHTRSSELELAVQRVIDQLPERSRTAYLLHRQQDMSYAEIAVVMGISVRTVENHIARALRGFREGLAAWIV